MKRRDFLLASGATLLGLSALSSRSLGAEGKRPKVLYFTRSNGFEHSVVKRDGDKLAHSERIFTEMGVKAGFDVTCTKDGKVFDDDLAQWDLIAFYTSGTLTDGGKDPGGPMSEEGKKRLLDAVAAGKPFVGFHAATDSFRTPDGQVDPYIAMLGGEFMGHGSQQNAPMQITSPRFPGMAGLGESFSMLEEWYTFKKFAGDLHVILVQDTSVMRRSDGGDKLYDRPPFPATWARMHGKGRVFYTSMGHREDVWTSQVFQQVVLGGMAWALGQVDADITPNIENVAPKANQLPA